MSTASTYPQQEMSQPPSSSWAPHSDTIRLWVDQLGTEGCRTFLTVKADTVAERLEIYQRSRSSDLHRVALDEGALVHNWFEGKSLVDNISARMDWQQVIQTLIDGHTLYTEEDLRGVIDSGFNNGAAILRAIWEAKFLQEEGEVRQVQTLVRALAKWTIGRPETLLAEEFKSLETLDIPPAASVGERYDTVMLWLTLGAQNDLFDRVILPLDGFDRAFRSNSMYQWYDELEAFLLSARKWSGLGCPLGILIGVEDFPMDTLGDNPLGRQLQSNLV